MDRRTKKTEFIGLSGRAKMHIVQMFKRNIVSMCKNETFKMH